MRLRTAFGAMVTVAAAATSVSLVMPGSAGAATAPLVPAAIQVPSGNVLAVLGHARGYQVYQCQSTGSGAAYALLYPYAGLVDDAGQFFAIHYAGPSWQAADHSVVVGARVASAPATAPSSIPWLLLQATSHSGPAGGTFSDVTYVQRVNTVGGVAPANGCDANHLGATVAVSYTADYAFYRSLSPPPAK